MGPYPWLFSQHSLSATFRESGFIPCFFCPSPAGLGELPIDQHHCLIAFSWFYWVSLRDLVISSTFLLVFSVSLKQLFISCLRSFIIFIMLCWKLISSTSSGIGYSNLLVVWSMDSGDVMLPFRLLEEFLHWCLPISSFKCSQESLGVLVQSLLY